MGSSGPRGNSRGTSLSRLETGLTQRPPRFEAQWSAVASLGHRAPGCTRFVSCRRTPTSSSSLNTWTLFVTVASLPELGSPLAPAASFWDPCLPNGCRRGGKSRRRFVLNRTTQKWNPSVPPAHRGPEMVTRPQGHALRWRAHRYSLSGWKYP